MVLPPTELKRIITLESGSATYDALKKRRYLRENTGEVKDAVLSLVAEYQRPQGDGENIVVGPSSLDRLASALLPYLNERGQSAYRSPPMGDRVAWWRRALAMIRSTNR